MERRYLDKKSKKYINEYLYPQKNNVDDFDGASDILCELKINKDDYYTPLAISKDNDYELHFAKPQIHVSSTNILTVVCYPGKQIWMYSLFSVNTRLFHTCFLIYENPKVNVL